MFSTPVRTPSNSLVCKGSRPALKPYTWFVSKNPSSSSSSAIGEQHVETASAGLVADVALTGDEIRERMALIRVNIEEHSVEVKAQTEALSDWRYYVRRYPWLSVGSAAVLGYSIVPRRSNPDAKNRQGNSKGVPGASSSEDMRTALVGMVKRAAKTYASKRLGSVVGEFFANDVDQ